MIKFIIIAAILSFNVANAEVENSKYTTLDGAVSVPIPEGVEKENIRDQIDQEGISSQCMFLPKDGRLLGIYSTKIRKQFPKTDAVLDRMAARYRQSIKAEDGSSLEYIEKLKIGERLLLLTIVRHIEQGNATRLKDDWLKNDLLIRADVLEARMYLIHNGYLVEFKRLVLPEVGLNMGELDENEYATQAVKDVIAFCSSSSAVSDFERAAFMDFPFKNDYIIGVYKDPSLKKSEMQP